MKTDSEIKMSGKCPDGADLAAFALGELDCVDAPKLSAHIAHCANCRAELESLTAAAEAVAAADLPASASELRPALLEEIARREADAATAPDRARHWPRVLKYAAGIALLLGSALALQRQLAPFIQSTQTTADAQAEHRAVAIGAEWLTAKQNADGGWSVELFGGSPRYSAALNGLALLALTRAEQDCPGIAGAAASAARHLAGLQNEDGSFGPDFDRALYNHGIATLALLSAYEVGGDAELRGPIERALDYTRAQQSYNGGWGYEGPQSARANNSVTAWQLQSLILAQRLGLSGNREALRSALVWIAGTIDRRGQFSYGAIGADEQVDSGNVTMMSAFCLMAASDIEMPIDPALRQTVLAGVQAQAQRIPDDYYAAFYYSSALAKADTPESKQVLQRLKRDLLARRADGAWLADDRWSPVGGRIYSTAMSLMAIRQ
jgi:hypothetical protein